MTFWTKAIAAPAVLAAASLSAMPARAAVLPTINHAPVGATSQYGPYAGGGWGRGWGGYRGDHHRRGSTVGGVLAGVLVLGAIAAAANAAKRAQQPRPYPQPYPYPDRPYPDRPYPYQRGGEWRSDSAQGLQGAANQCLRAVEIDARAREVTRVERSANGWLVTGEMADGAPFSCSINADGRIDRLDIGGRARVLGSTGQDLQYGDDVYRSARAGAGVAADAGPQPAYPGGPLPGDEREDVAPKS